MSVSISIFNTLVTLGWNLASERVDGSISVPRTLVAGTFTGSVQTRKQNKSTLSRPRTRADTPSSTPRGAHMYQKTTPVRLRWFRCDWVTLRRRRPRRQQSSWRQPMIRSELRCPSTPDFLHGTSSMWHTANMGPLRARFEVDLGTSGLDGATSTARMREGRFSHVKLATCTASETPQRSQQFRLHTRASPFTRRT